MSAKPQTIATLAPSQNGKRTATELWHAWSALVLLRAALRRRPAHFDLLPEEAREIAASLLVNSKGPEGPPLDPGTLETIEEELRQVRSALEAAGPCSLDRLVERYSLTPQEREVVSFLFSHRVSPLFAAIREGLNLKTMTDTGVKISLLIEALFPDAPAEKSLGIRRIFHPSGALMSREILELDASKRGLEEPDLLAEEATLSARVVNQLVGDDTSYALLSAFLQADIPEVEERDIILPPGVKEQVLKAVEAWLGDRERSGAKHPLSLLFYGPPGTGKTLLAHALSARFRLPLVRLRMPNGGRRRSRALEGLWDTEELVRFVLREAQAIGGIAFFDECDDIFARDSYESRGLLLQIERHAGMVILATNSPHRLDSALDRRVSLRIPFSLPSRDDRRRIWEVHLAREGKACDGIDLGELADRFLFAGGYIRNAVSMAALRAGAGHPIRRDGLLEAAHEQSVHFCVDISNYVITRAEMPEFSAVTLEKLAGLVRVGRDALDRGLTLRVRLRGASLDELRSAAGAVAWRLKVGTVFCTASALESKPDRPGPEEERPINEGAVQTLLAALPPDCALAIEDPEGKSRLDLFWKLAQSRPGIYFHLDGFRGPKKPSGPCHFAIDLEPPDPIRRAVLWREALKAEGIECDDALALALAEGDLSGQATMAEVARMARWKALSGNREAASPDDVVSSARELARGGSPDPLFGP